MEKIANVDVQTAVPTAKIQQNIVDARAHCLTPINELFSLAHGDEPIALIGGGPSLSGQINKVRHYRHIIIAGSAHDYFMENIYDLTSTDSKIYCIICDPDPIMCDYLCNWNKNVIYLIASQCDKAIFELFEKTKNKYIWHAAGGDDYNKSSFPEGEKLITGGCTVGTRAIGMAMAMGFKKLHFFGYDSCLTNQYKHHAYDFVNPDYETLGDIKEVKLGGEDSPVFRCAGYMLGQIFDFQHILHAYADKLQIKVFGGGALAYLMELAEKKMLALKEHKNGACT